VGVPIPISDPFRRRWFRFACGVTARPRQWPANAQSLPPDPLPQERTPATRLPARRRHRGRVRRPLQRRQVLGAQRPGRPAGAGPDQQDPGTHAADQFLRRRRRSPPRRPTGLRLCQGGAGDQAALAAGDGGLPRAAGIVGRTGAADGRAPPADRLRPRDAWLVCAPRPAGPRAVDQGGQGSSAVRPRRPACRSFASSRRCTPPPRHSSSRPSSAPGWKWRWPISTAGSPGSRRRRSEPPIRGALHLAGDLPRRAGSVRRTA
jgi:hypothetical protein